MTARRLAAAAAMALLDVTLLGVTLPLPAAAAPAEAPSPAATDAEPSALPGLGQTLDDYRQSGCRKPSDRAAARTPWAQAVLRPQDVWPLSEGAGVTVAVVGSGVDGASGAFEDRLTAGAHEYPAGPAPDCVGHGTFVAGLIAARRAPGVGFAGLAPRAGLLAVGVTDQVGTTTADLLAKGIRAAADGGARVIDVAVPSATGSADLAAAVQYAVGRGALVVAPAGADDRNRQQGPAYPAAYPEVLAVSDLGPDGTGGQGSPAGRVDLVAPGDAVLSIGPAGAGYFTASGPSYAAALVAGSAALVLGYRPELTEPQLLHRLESTAYRPGTALPDPRLGYGTVDPVSAVTSVLPEEPGRDRAPAGRQEAVSMPPRRQDTATGPALLVSGAALGAIALTGAAAAVLPRGRRRSWRAGAYRRPDLANGDQ